MPTLRRILHIAPQNISGVPITFVRAERRLGFESRLITLLRDPRGYEEDICLELPFLRSPGLRWIKRVVSPRVRLQISNRQRQPSTTPPRWYAHSRAESMLFALRERIWQARIARAMAEIDFWNFDLYQLEGGLEFFRDGRTVQELRRRGKKIVCLYTGSDLRTRGLIPAIDACADLRLTLEFDHLALDPSLTHILFPFEFDKYPPPPPHDNAGRLVIGHAPTNRAAKGSAEIIAAVQSLARDFPLQFELIEGVPHAEAMRRKAQCDIFIDNLGELGYGVNAVEGLALGICTCTSLMPEFLARYPDHPFVEITFENLQAQLRRLCANPSLRQNFAQRGREWAERNHGATNVVRKMQALLSGA
ncbi:glycosyltransferase [candidate division KSB1 bacterium]|nr:glycosyltransferase [candidate division KSB1 bacterium]